jgi:hypothetical protein
MAGKLILLPLRVWLRSARLLTRAAGGAAERAVSLAGQTIGVASSNGSDRGRPSAPATAEPGWREESIEEPVSPVDVEHPDDERPSPEASARSRDTARARPETAARARTRTAAATRPRTRSAPAPRPLSEEPEPQTPLDQEPVHVSEEPELVRELAESGAEDGAGAHVTVNPPWDGYAQMNAREVIARAGQASPAELAAVRLYESRHRSRQTVLAAVDRQLKLASGSNPA